MSRMTQNEVGLLKKVLVVAMALFICLELRHNPDLRDHIIKVLESSEESPQYSLSAETRQEIVARWRE